MIVQTTREPGNRDWSEAELVEGIARDDAAAGSAFVSRSHDAVYGYACRLTLDRDLRQDWTHDALLRLMADVKDGSFVYLRPGSLWAWFRVRAWYLVLDARRRESARIRREPLSEDGELPDHPGDDDASLGVEEAEAAAALNDCLESMSSPDQSRALRLRAVEDLPYDRIAGVMDVPLNTVRTWIRRGRVALRRCLAARFGWPLPGDEA